MHWAYVTSIFLEWCVKIKILWLWLDKENILFKRKRSVGVCRLIKRLWKEALEWSGEADLCGGIPWIVIHDSFCGFGDNKTNVDFWIKAHQSACCHGSQNLYKGRYIYFMNKHWTARNGSEICWFFPPIFSFFDHILNNTATVFLRMIDTWIIFQFSVILWGKASMNIKKEISSLPFLGGFWYVEKYSQIWQKRVGFNTFSWFHGYLTMIKVFWNLSFYIFVLARKF